MENSFTNVPVQETINIIINNIYHHPTLSPLKMNTNTLRKILLLCTTEVLFYDPHENIFIQQDGITMWSILRLILSHLENKVFNTIHKPNIYLRFLTTDSFSLTALMKLTRYKRPFKIIPFLISHKNSISTIKSHFWCNNRHTQYWPIYHLLI